MKITTPKSVNIIIKFLNDNGYEAYAVGGCVRDAILGKEPNDWDITTSALPEQVKELFHKTIDTGIAHGTVTVMIDRVGYEVTTYRIDGEYEDGRHPKNVEFTGNLIEDLKRRDFTINAMAYNGRDGIVDAFDGISDINNKIIRCVGVPQDRFNEDALRILRTVRFSATLDFEIEEETYKAVKELAGNLEKISKERIQAELEKLLMSEHPDRIITLYDTGIANVIFPEIVRLKEMDKLDEVAEMLGKMPENHYLRWSCLFAFSTKQEASGQLRNLKFDNKTIDVVSRIVDASKRELPKTAGEIRRDVFEIGEDVYKYYLEFMKIFMEERKDEISGIEKEYGEILERGECTSLKGLAVNGRDLIELGVKRGSEVGEGLKMLLYKVLENPNLNERETLLNIFVENRS